MAPSLPTARRQLETDEAVCVEVYKQLPQLGRFVLREEGLTLGMGAVTSTEPPAPAPAPADDDSGGGAEGGD